MLSKPGMGSISSMNLVWILTQPAFRCEKVSLGKLHRFSFFLIILLRDYSKKMHVKEHSGTFENSKLFPENQLQMELSRLLMFPENLGLNDPGDLRKEGRY